MINSERRMKSKSAWSSVMACVVLWTGCAGSGQQAPDVPPPASQEPEAPRAKPVPATLTVTESTPAIQEETFGEFEGEPVQLYTLTNANKLVLKAMTYGAIITELHVPDADGTFADIVLGYDRLDDYVAETPYFGATIGRVANRIKNARFELDGKRYTLAANDGDNHLHGGSQGWDKVLWKAQAKETEEGPQLVFSYTSPDGEEGYPGNVQAEVVYTLTHQNELKVEMRATTDQATLVNMAHHSYWNLGGHASGTILDHELELRADHYTPAVGLVPDGRVKPVEGTPFDFMAAKPIGQDLTSAGGDPVGYDHNWIVDGEPNQMRLMARLIHPESGRVMELSANQPGIQFYSGNFLDGSLTGKGGTSYGKYTGLCLESQKIPNSINVPAWRDDVILRPGEEYVHEMVHRFTTQ